MSSIYYLPCARHESALSRMEFERAVDVATDCPDCIVHTRPEP